MRGPIFLFGKRTCLGIFVDPIDPTVAWPDYLVPVSSCFSCEMRYSGQLYRRCVSTGAPLMIFSFKTIFFPPSFFNLSFLIKTFSYKPRILSKPEGFVYQINFTKFAQHFTSKINKPLENM